MTSQERVEAALRHTQPDRTPFFEYVLLSPIADRVVGRPYADYAGDSERWEQRVAAMGWEKAVRSYVQDRLDLAQALEHDMMYVCPNPSSRQGPTEPEPPTADPVERVLWFADRRAGETPGPKEENLLVYHLLRGEMERRGIDLPILAPAYAHGIWTNTDLMQAMLLDPDAARAHFAQATRSAMAYIEAYLSLGITQIGVGGDFPATVP